MLVFRDELSMKMFSNVPDWWVYRFPRKRKLRSARAFAASCGLLLAASAPTNIFCSSARAEPTDPAKPVVVQPGAPGKPSIQLPPSTTAKLPPRSQAEVDFKLGR